MIFQPPDQNGFKPTVLVGVILVGVIHQQFTLLLPKALEIVKLSPSLDSKTPPEQHNNTIVFFLFYDLLLRSLPACEHHLGRLSLKSHRTASRKHDLENENRGAGSHQGPAFCESSYGL